MVLTFPFFRVLFLTARSLCVDQHRSRRIFLIADIPQGSLLPPLLLNAHVNDLTDVNTHCKIFQHADGILILSSYVNYADAVSLLQQDVTYSFEWCVANSICVNNEKIELICFRHSLKRVSVGIPLYMRSSSCSTNCYSKPIEYVASVIYLVIKVDSYLFRNTHFSYVCKHLRSVSCYLHNIKYILDFP